MRSRPSRRRFVPRVIFETALVAVVPSITAPACRRPLGVAHRGFEQQTVAAQVAAPDETMDAGANASETSDVIDAGANVEDSNPNAVVVQPDRDVERPPAVAYQGFTNASDTQPVAGPADAGPRSRSRRR